MSGTAKRKGLGTLTEFLGRIIPSLPRIPIKWVKFYLGPTGGELLRRCLAEAFRFDPRFEEIGSFLVVVPGGYDHDTALTKFKEEHCGEFGYYDTSLTDTNFAKTAKLTPGRKFRVKMLAVKSGQVVSSDDCLKVIAAHKGVLTGAQGVTLAYEQGKSYMSCKGKWFVSFDNSENLPYLNDCHEVPCMVTDTNDSFVFSFGGFEDDWRDYFVLLCFCDEKS